MLNSFKRVINQKKDFSKVRKEVEIKFDHHSMIRFKAHYLSFERTWENENLSKDFSLSDFIKYCELCLFLRVCNQNGKIGKFYSEYRKGKLPSLIYLVLSNLGNIDENNLQIECRVITSFGWDSKNFNFDQDFDHYINFMKEMRFKLTKLEDMGHEMSGSLPKEDRKGSLSFMLMQAIDEIMTSHNYDSHPVYAFLKSFIKCSSLQDLLNPRIFYLSRDEYDFQYQCLIRSRNESF